MAGLRANNVLAHLTERAVTYIEEQDPQNPFFLYFPLTAPHTPIAPGPDFAGQSGINPYADFCMEVDTRVGQILTALQKSGLDHNTLVIFTTDNGASRVQSECDMLEKQYGHYSSYIYRGYKSDIWDGGHRIPFLVRWPAQIQANTVCEERVGIFDLFATAAELTGTTVPDNAGEDSVSLLPAFRGDTIPEAADRCLIHHSIDGMFALRRGDWKLCRCPGSGGWSFRERDARWAQCPDNQLYHMADDPAEQNNLALRDPDRVEELTHLLHRAVVRGRTTDGTAVQNDPEVPVESWQQLNWLPDIPESFVIDD